MCVVDMHRGARDGPFQGHVEAAACRFQRLRWKGEGEQERQGVTGHATAPWQLCFEGRRKGFCFVLAQASTAAAGSWCLRAQQQAHSCLGGGGSGDSSGGTCAESAVGDAASPGIVGGGGV